MIPSRSQTVHCGSRFLLQRSMALQSTAKKHKKGEQAPAVRKQKTRPRRETHARTHNEPSAGQERSQQLRGHRVLLPLVGWVAGARATGPGRSGHRQAACHTHRDPKSWSRQAQRPSGSLGGHNPSTCYLCSSTGHPP